MNIKQLKDYEELGQFAFGVSGVEARKKIESGKYFEGHPDFNQMIDITRNIQDVIGFKLSTSTFIARRFNDELTLNLKNEGGTVKLFCAIGTPLHDEWGIICFFVYHNNERDYIVTIDLKLLSPSFKKANISLTVEDLRKNKWQLAMKRASLWLSKGNKKCCKEKIFSE